MKSLINFTSQFKILKLKKTSLIISALLGSATISFAAPSGADVTSGTANISQNGNVTNINQSSSKASINWQNFSIASNEIVNFNQPDVNSITLNKVIGNEKSIIDGALNANGQVWLLNSNGVLFGKNASINTAGILASTAELSDSDFQAGNYNFKNTTSNSVINEGTIEISNNGSVILSSNEVKNTGTIKAVKGKVLLVGVDSYSLNLNGNSLVNLTVDKGVLDSLVENSGTIIADGGEIYLTTNAVDELLRGVVNNTGIIEANSIDDLFGKVEVSSNIIVNNGEIKASGNKGGTITQTANMIIDAGITDVSAVNDAGTITQNSEQIKQSTLAALKANSQTANAGSINLISDVDNLNSNVYASGDMSATGVNGGNVNITASSVNVIGANLTSTGTNNAGNIKIGGDWQGAETTLDNANSTRVLNSNITNEGNNGEIVVWSEDETSFNSTILAQNTQVEISSKDTLNFSGVNVKANSLLLDYENVEIKDIEVGLDYLEINNPNNTAGDEFQIVAELSNTNLVAIAIGTDIGSISNIGAVYLFQSDGTLISTLIGTSTDDKVGSEGVTVLSNDNYVITSSYWDNKTISNVGAVTWGSSTEGISGLVSSTNSLIGSTTDDYVGLNGVTGLTSGDYVVASSSWDHEDSTVDVGAVTWANGVNGTFGEVKSTNSLVGKNTYDNIGISGVTALNNGNYVVASSNWDSTTAVNAGAATFIDVSNTDNLVGEVNSSNSLIGGKSYDYVANAGVVAIKNGDYVVSSSIWSTEILNDVGAVTYVDTSENYNVIGNVSSSNSLIGGTANDKVGAGGVTALSDGNYVINSTYWDSDKSDVGAITFVNVSNPNNVKGIIDSSNSLIGTREYDRIGYGGVTALNNGNYVVNSYFWSSNEYLSSNGAVTFVDTSKSNSFIGTVNSSNSLIGITANDNVGNGGVTALSNGNYVVSSYYWDNNIENRTNVGAVTWGSGTNGVYGEVDSSNSLIGTRALDSIGNAGITALSNGNYIIASPNWNNGNIVDAGAATLVDGTKTVTGTINTNNSFIGNYSILALDNAKAALNKTSANNGGTSLITDFSTSTFSSIASTNPSENSEISPEIITAALSLGTDVTLQANNDITLSNTITTDNLNGDGGTLTLQAGRSINLNANLTTDNGDFISLAGDTNAISNNTDTGTATITIANGVSIDAGTGKIILYANGGNFINNSGSTTPFTSSLTSIYLPSFTNATLNNLTVNNKRYNTTYANGCLTTNCTLPTSGLSMLYSIAPELTVTPNSNQTAVYGDTFSSTYSISGYVNSDTENTSGITGTALFTAGTKSSSDNYIVGTHDVEYTSGLLSSLGYLFKEDTSSSGEYIITVKPITVSADDLTKVYGQNDETLTYSAIGLEIGDTLTGSLTRIIGENIGEYIITEDTMFSNSNYTISFTNGKYIITPKPITVKADDLTKVYGTNDEILTYSTDGLVRDDSLTGSLKRVAGENVAEYVISQYSTLENPNYTINFIDGKYTIIAKPITVRADDLTKVYGTNDEILTYSTDGLETGDSLTGNLSRVVGENIGDYNILKGGLINSNYDIIFTNGKYTITPKLINYNFGNAIEAGTSNGSEYLLNELFSNSTLFGDTSSLISNDDYQFIYNGNNVRGFTNANTYYPISLRFLNNNFLLGNRNYDGTVIIKNNFSFDFNKLIPRRINSNKLNFDTTNNIEQIKNINKILKSLKTKFKISENEEEKKRVKEILESLY